MAVATRHYVLHEKISIASKQYSLESVHVFALQVLQLIDIPPPQKGGKAALAPEQ